MDEHEKNPVFFQPGDGVRALCSRLSRSCRLSPGLPPSSTLCAAVVHSDAAWARFSLSFWLISTGSVCLTRQEREKLLVGWMVDEVDCGGGMSRGDITPPRHGGRQAGSESTHVGWADSAISPNKQLFSFFSLLSPTSQQE